MPDKQKEYQRIHNLYESRPGLLNYAERQQEQQEKDRRLPGVDDAKYLMDAEQLRDYYEERNRDTEDNSFRIRTKYYFEDFNRADAKAHRYRALADNEEMVNDYAQRHGGRRAYKRKGDAGKAAKKFREMQRLMANQMSQNQDDLTPLQKYYRREEVMRLRMEGMIAAAQLKSKPGNMHHLVARAEYSCFMILKDQLTHLINEQQSRQDQRKLRRKLDTVNEKLDTLFKDLKKYTPSVQKQWQENQFNNIQYETAHRQYQAQCSINVLVSKETSSTLFHLQKFHEQFGNVQWPARCVYKTKEGDAPINPAERKMQEWNNRVQEIRENGSQYAKRRVEEEGIRIFMNTELPSAQTLKTMGAKYLEDHLRTYYEMTHIALDYYKREIEKGKGFLYSYAENNTDFKQKLAYVEAIRDYMTYRLKKDHGIRTDQEHGYAINKDGAGYNDWLGGEMERHLIVAERDYGIFGNQKINKFGLMPEIPTNAERPLLEDDDDDYDDDEEEIEEQPKRVVHRNRQEQPVVQPVRNMELDPHIQIVENRLYSDVIVREEKKNEPKIEIIEEEKKEEEPKDEIIVEKKEEEKKEEPKIENIEEEKKEEEKKEEPKKEIIVEKKEEEEDDDDDLLVEDSVQKKEKGSLADAFDQLQKDLEEQKKEALRQKEEEDRERARIQEEQKRRNEEIEKGRKLYEERQKREDAKKKAQKQPENEINENKINVKDEINENKINVINENRIIVDDEAPVKMIQNAEELLEHAEYQGLLGEAEAVFAKYKVEEEEEETTPKAKKTKEKTQEKKTQEKNAKEAIASMMRLVHFDKEGAPVTKEDKKNHAWNLKWLTAWKEDQFYVREEMIREELNQIADCMISLPDDNVSKADREFLEKNDFDFINRKVMELEAIKKDGKLGSKNAKLLAELSGKKKTYQKTMTAYRKGLEKWSRIQFEEKGNDGFMAALHKMCALSNLDMAHPALKMYCEKNKAFDSYRQVMESLSAYLKHSGSKRKRSESKEEHTDKLNALAFSVMKETWQYREHEKDPYAPYVSKGLAVMETKKEREAEFHADAINRLGLKEAHFAPKVSKNQKKELEFAKKQYEIMNYYKGLGKFETCQEYLDLFAKLGPESSLERSLTAMMKPVQFDKNNHPLPRYKENHEWNLKWLKTWVDKDEKERERMVETYYPRSLDEVKDADFPEVKLPSNDFAVMRQYGKYLAEYNVQKEKLDDFKETFRKNDKKADLRSDPTYKQLMKELTEISAKRNALMGEAEAIAKRYAAGKEFQRWATGKIKDRSDHDANIFLRSRAQGSVDVLRKLCPFVEEYERRNSRFSKKAKMLERIAITYCNYVKNNYGVECIAVADYSDDWLKNEEAKNGSISDTGAATLAEYIVLWMEYNNVEMQDKEEDAAELARIQKEKNKLFTKEDYAIYKKLKSVKELTNNKIYKDIDLGKTKERYELSQFDSLDRFALIGFKPVQFDKSNQPVSKKDEENHEWNLKWIRAWEKDDINTREEMIGEILPGLYDQIKLPEFKLSKEDQQLINLAARKEEEYDQAYSLYMNCLDQEPEKGEKLKVLEEIKNKAKEERDQANDKLMGLSEKCQGTLVKWLEETAADPEMVFVRSNLCSLSLDNLQRIHPSVARYFKENPAIQELVKMIDRLGELYTGRFLPVKHSIKMAMEVNVEDVETAQLGEEIYRFGLETEMPNILKDFVKYNQEKAKEKKPFVSLSSNEGYVANEKEREEYIELQEQQPRFTQKGYSVYKTMKKARSIGRNEEYIRLYDKAEGVLSGVDAPTVDRGALFIMRHVDVDQKGEPLTKQDKENHEWNLRWLRALEEDDFEERERMIAEEIPKRFQIRELPKPSEKLLKLHQKMKEGKKQKDWKNSWEGKRLEQEYQMEIQNFQKTMEDFVEKKVENQDVAFFEEIQRGGAFDSLRKLHPSVQQYWDKNPEIVKREQMVDAYGLFQNVILAEKYLIDCSSDLKVVEGTGSDLDYFIQNQRYIMVEQIKYYLDKYLDYQQLEDKSYTAFQPVVTDEDREK